MLWDRLLHEHVEKDVLETQKKTLIKKTEEELLDMVGHRAGADIKPVSPVAANADTRKRSSSSSSSKSSDSDRFKGEGNSDASDSDELLVGSVCCVAGARSACMPAERRAFGSVAVAWYKWMWHKHCRSTCACSGWCRCWMQLRFLIVECSKNVNRAKVVSSKLNMRDSRVNIDRQGQSD